MRPHAWLVPIAMLGSPAIADRGHGGSGHGSGHAPGHATAPAHPQHVAPASRLGPPARGGGGTHTGTMRGTALEPSPPAPDVPRSYVPVESSSGGGFFFFGGGYAPDCVEDDTGACVPLDLDPGGDVARPADVPIPPRASESAEVPARTSRELAAELDGDDAPVQRAPATSATHAMLDCLDIRVEPEGSRAVRGTVIGFEIHNRCDAPAAVDLGHVVVASHTSDGTPTYLDAYDPGHDLRAFWLPPLGATAATITFTARTSTTQICLDAASIAGRTEPTWLCL
jgi:hypothetical protein